MSQVTPTGSTAASRAMHLGRALVWKGWREQRLQIVLAPVGFAALILVFTLTALYVPGLFTWPTRDALARQAALAFGAVHGNVGLAMAMLLIQGPYFVALFTALTAATVAQGALGSEAMRGSFELFLAAAYRPADIFGALLIASLTFTLIAWTILAASTLGLAGLTMLVLQATVHLSGEYVALAVLMPLPVALWAGVIALFLGMMFPRLASLRTGVMTSLLQVVAILPALILVLWINLKPDAHLASVDMIAIGAGLLGTALSVLVVRKFFRAEVMLES